VIAAAMAVPGVDYATPVRFQRLGRNPQSEIENGRMAMARLEIAPRQRPECTENGRIRFDRRHRNLTMNDATASLDDCGCCKGLQDRRPSATPRAAGAALSRRHPAGLLCAHAAKPAAVPSDERAMRRARSTHC
jgi:hypothetical protein